MKTYSDLQGINTQLLVRIKLTPLGYPSARLTINKIEKIFPEISSEVALEYHLGLLDHLTIEVELYNKDYTLDYETAVVIDVTIDNINVIPEYNHLVEYSEPTNYLGFNKKWVLQINQPFYHWLHKNSGQGWLIS